MPADLLLIAFSGGSIRRCDISWAISPARAAPRAELPSGCRGIGPQRGGYFGLHAQVDVAEARNSKYGGRVRVWSER